MNDTNSSFTRPNVEVARDFTRHLTDLLRKENGALVNFLLALAECDGRRLWADLGYASLFDYLHRELKLSKSSAWYRSSGAALIMRYPAVADALGDGRLCVSTLGEVRKVITPDNAAEILPRFFHCSAREAKEIAAAIAPAAASPRQDLITRVHPVQRTVSTRTEAELAPVVQTSEPSPFLRPSRPEADAPPIPSSIAPPVRMAARHPPQEEVRPLTAELRRLHVTVTKEWLAKLEAAKDALSHSIPSGSAEKVLEAALDALLERETKRKGLAVKKGRAARLSHAGKTDRAQQPEQAQQPAPTTNRPEYTDSATPRSRAPHRKAIPADVRRQVVQRDEDRCQARLHDGSVCGSRTRTQLDHVIPVALGGPSTVNNVRVLCERHNQLAARRVFGDAVMDPFARAASRS